MILSILGRCLGGILGRFVPFLRTQERNQRRVPKNNLSGIRFARFMRSNLPLRGQRFIEGMAFYDSSICSNYL